MKVEDKILQITVKEFNKILEDNPDKSKDSENIKRILIDIIKKNKNKLTIKQRRWIMDKLRYIISHNRKLKKVEYIKIPIFNDLKIIPEKIKETVYIDKEIGFSKFFSKNN